MTDSQKNVSEVAAPDPFNLDSLRAPQDFQQTGGVKKTTLNVRASSRPPKDKFIRVHPFDFSHGSEEWCLNVIVFAHQPEGELTHENFIVPSGSDAYGALLDRLRPTLIVCGITASQSRFLWELTLPASGSNRRTNQWHETRLACAKKAVDTWIRLEADTDAGGYNFVEPLTTIPDPDWGKETFRQLFVIAYRDRIVDSVDHPVVKEFLGA